MQTLLLNIVLVALRWLISSGTLQRVVESVGELLLRSDMSGDEKREWVVTQIKAEMPEVSGNLIRLATEAVLAKFKGRL